jgi:hypothetical protein
MPRDGANIYTLPFPDVVTDTTIASPVYNGFTHDVAQDLNAPRPIVAGGTGATSADGALTSMGAEKAQQQVTNFDSHVWLPGSFYSTATATGEPVDGHAFSGVAYINEALTNPPTNANVTVEARDLTTGLLWIRRKVANVWGSWALDTAATDAAIATKVAKAGDTMTGPLTVNSTIGASGTITSSGTVQGATVVGGVGGVWAQASASTGTYQFGTSGGKYLTYNGSDFFFNGGGLNAPSVVGGSVWTQASASTGTYYFGTSGSKYLTYDGTSFTLNGGQLIVNSNMAAAGNIQSITSPTTGACFFGSSGSQYLTYDGTNYLFGGSGQVLCPGNVQLAGVIVLNYGAANGGTLFFGNNGTQSLNANGGSGFYEFNSSGGVVRLAQGFAGRAGTAGGGFGSIHNFFWTGSAVQAWVDTSNLGNVSITSDYRTKKDVSELPGMWGTVKALRPIKYTQKDYGIFVADDVERWGFIAHELQETLTESAATGVKDAPDQIQSPNPFTVIAALTKALQEAMQRIEALEARP